MAGLGSLDRVHGLTLVEDAAQAHGAQFEGQGVGSFGVGCFSLYATKNVATGEGGMVTTNDATRSQIDSGAAQSGMRARYEYEMAGHNYRLTDIQAAIGIPQMAQLEEAIGRREANAAFLSSALGALDGVVVPHVRDGCRHVWHQYTIRVTADAARSTATRSGER